MYHLEICGADIFSNYSSNWNVLVNTGIDGIALPNDYYRMIMSWISNANFTKDSELPSLSFSLSEKGKRFYIPLSSLYNKITEKYMIYQITDVNYYYYGEIILQNSPRIEIGSSVFHSLYMVFDTQSYKVGLIQKDESVKDEREFCKKKKMCKGQQEYYEPMNECLDPYCAIFQSKF
jgi:hypothetical protein